MLFFLLDLEPNIQSNGLILTTDCLISIALANPVQVYQSGHVYLNDK